MASGGFVDLDAIAGCAVRAQPYRWGLIDPTFRRAELVRSLADCFPDAPRDLFVREHGDKRHRLEGWRLVEGGEAQLPALWSELITEVHGPDYRRAVEAATGLALADCSREITFWCHSAGCYLDPHPDKPEKIVSHLFYFNEDWTRDLGGALLILGSSRFDDVVEAVVPNANRSVVIVRSARSWHAFDRIVATTRRRLAMQVVFHLPGLRYTDHPEARA